MWSTHPNINPETTLSPSGHSPGLGHNAAQEDAADATLQATPSTVAPQGELVNRDCELALFSCSISS